ncbi:MAG: aminopeptidase P N-terminal domain-containing protein [Proteobacteria bacterium]|nr:aminopeptidase P N-terminal domain-containing protein [Pseudomonadota bacterium]
MAILPAAPVAIRNHDVEHSYRQDSDLYYLTGLEEPDSLLILTNTHAEHRCVLFVRPRDPERETWDGPRVGVEGAKQLLGADEAYPIDALSQRLPEYLAGNTRAHYRFGPRADLDRLIIDTASALRRRVRTGVVAPRQFLDPGLILHETRLRKSEQELRSIRKAVSITREAHGCAMAVALPGRYEYEVEAELLRVFRGNGSERPAYDPIVGSGPNATILHYRKNNRRLEDGDLLLIDAGAEYEYYASDITRTFPVSGRFSDAQRRLYEVVLEAQQAAIDAVAPGRTLQQVHEAGLRVMVQGLLGLGLLHGSADQVIEEERYKPLFMHRTSHWLGMDVHDVGDYFIDGEHRELEPGFVLTVEPGVYVAEAAEVDPQWRGTGIRIEDDVLVTTEGNTNLSAEIPKHPDELERLLAKRAPVR